MIYFLKEYMGYVIQRLYQLFPLLADECIFPVLPGCAG